MNTIKFARFRLKNWPTLCAMIYRELDYDLQIRHHLNFISSAKNLILPQLLLSYTLIDVVAEHFVHFLNTVKQVIYIKTLNVYCNLWLKTFPQFKFSWSVEKVEIKAVFAECELRAKQKLVVELQICKPCLSMFNTLLHYMQHYYPCQKSVYNAQIWKYADMHFWILKCHYQVGGWCGLGSFAHVTSKISSNIAYMFGCGAGAACLMHFPGGGAVLQCCSAPKLGLAVSL